MLLNLNLPRLNAYMTDAIIDRIYGVEDSEVLIGGKLFDLTVDLSAAAPHDCPPVGHFRLLVRERVWLRKLYVRPGDEREIGATLALFGTEANEPLSAAPVRQVRVAIAGIVPQGDWEEIGF